VVAKKKKIEAREGDLFAIPLCDGSFGLGHVVHVVVCGRDRTPSIVLLSAHGHALQQLLDHGRVPVSAMIVTGDMLADGDWPIIGNESPTYPFAIPRDDEPGSSCHTAIAAPRLLEFLHGIRKLPPDWKPSLQEQLLLPGMRMPPGWKDGAIGAEASGGPRASTAAANPPEGPGELHVAILYEGNGMPTVEDLRLRQEAERRLGEIGEVTEAGAGGGIMDIYVQVDSGRRALARTALILRELGVTDRSETEVRPISQ